MLPHDKKPTEEKNPKKGKGKEKPEKKENSKDSGEEEKERKRRTSLTDSPLTSSSASTTSTMDSSDEQKSSSSKNPEDRKTKEGGESHPGSSKDVPGPSRSTATAPDDNQPDEEDKGKKRKSKKKKKKDSTDSKSDENAGAINADNPSKNDQNNNERSNSTTKAPDQNRSQASKPNEMKLSYSAASLNTGTTTVSSTTTKTSFADGLNTDLFSTSPAMSTPLTSLYDSSARSKNPYASKDVHPGENINRLEVENAHQVMSEQNKKVQTYNGKWMKMFHSAVVEGDYEKFLKNLNIIYNVMDENRTLPLKKMTEKEFKQYIMMGVVQHFYDMAENTTILMSLAATRDLTKNCEDVKHGYCKIITCILSELNAPDVNMLLQVVTRRTGRTAIHFAATTGQICQLKALLDFDINPDIIDKSGLAPIHHCIERNNLEMVKLLVRYGADPSLCPKDRFKHPPRLLAMANLQNNNLLASWLRARLDAIGTVFRKTVAECIGKYWQIVDTLSDFHFIRASENYNYKSFNLTPITRRIATLNLRADLTVRCNQAKTFAGLFMVPMYFYNDEVSSPSNPQIFRTSFYIPDSVNQQYQVIPQACITGLNVQETLKPLVQPQHNGYYYAYALPSSIADGPYKIDFELNIDPFRSQADQMIIVMGSFLCREIDEKERKRLESQIYNIPIFQKGRVKAKLD